MRLISKKNLIIILPSGCGIYGCIPDISYIQDGHRQFFLRLALREIKHLSV